MVRRPVGPDQPGTVQQQRHRQVLQGHFLEDLVVAPLQEGAVDVDDRPQAGLGQPGGEGHGVRLADAHVEEPLGKLVADRLEHVALAHGGGDRHDLRVRPHLLEHGVADQLGVGRPGEAFFSGTTEPFSRWKGAGAWNVVGSSAAGWKPCPFSVTTCSSTGPWNLPHHAQVLLQLADVVPVDRPDVAEAEVLEEHAAQQAGLDGVLDLREEPLDRVADHRHAVEHLLDLAFRPV